MDSLKLHQLLNYYPAIGTVAGAVLLAFGLARASRGVTRFALRLVFAVALLTLAVVFTGEFASWDISLYTASRGEALEQHKIMATAAFAVVEMAGAVSLVGLLRSENHGTQGRWAVLAAFALTIVASVMLVVVIFRGRQVKWASFDPGPRPVSARPIGAVTMKSGPAENRS